MNDAQDFAGGLAKFNFGNTANFLFEDSGDAIRL
jgi:hypothetical protein